MTDSISQEEVIDSTNNEAEGGGENEGDFVKVPKSDWEKTNQTLGSLKRELKDYKKVKEEPKETAQQTKTDNSLLEKAFLRSAQISSEEEVELALSTSKKWDMPVDKLVDDEDFKIKLDKLRTQKSNEIATSKIRGTNGKAQGKEDPAYWKAKGVPPTPNDIGDRKVRAKIIREMMANEKNAGGKYYNEK